VIGDGVIAQSVGVATAGLIVCIALAGSVAVVLISLLRDRAGQPA
jgi:hypothetical protein